ncbi:unnamed protein product [Phaeothamnion confervicola]
MRTRSVAVLGVAVRAVKAPNFPNQFRASVPCPLHVVGFFKQILVDHASSFCGLPASGKARCPRSEPCPVTVFPVVCPVPLFSRMAAVTDLFHLPLGLFFH